ncbi:MAG: NUDIX domain-containing protein [Candidatus Blackburnbacteria bacterium]|nr:NUDIX domain-containing protein [Candidatus Blackburnbacteria bacterium]
MHPIRRLILANLITSSKLPFSKLKPVDVESNSFMYHLKQIINDGLVEKVNGKYGLTKNGLIMAGQLSWKTFDRRIQPRIVTMVVGQNSSGEFLLYRSWRQPTLNLVGFPYGKLHFGEKVLEAANRELQEKTGLQGKLAHKGDVYVTICDKADVVNQMLVHVFVGGNLRGELTNASELGVCFWSKPDELTKTEAVPWFFDILALLSKNKNKFFFRELAYLS